MSTLYQDSTNRALVVFFAHPRSNRNMDPFSSILIQVSRDFKRCLSVKLSYGMQAVSVQSSSRGQSHVECPLSHFISSRLLYHSSICSA